VCQRKIDLLPRSNNTEEAQKFSVRQSVSCSFDFPAVCVFLLKALSLEKSGRLIKTFSSAFARTLSRSLPVRTYDVVTPTRISGVDQEAS
jgi:hypothetical protein